MSAASKYVLAVDSGGTKTEAILVAEDGTPLGWGRFDASVKNTEVEDVDKETSAEPVKFTKDGTPEARVQYGQGGRFGGAHRIGGGRSRKAIANAINQAMGDYQPEMLLVKRGYERLLTELFLFDCELIGVSLGEYSGAFMLAGETCGIVALAGTGAFVRGETRDGRTLHLDGFGPNLGDYGSGYQIGIQAIRAAARSIFHPRHKTNLVDPVLETCIGTAENKTVYNLVHYMLQYRDRSEIAALAKVVDKVACDGDQVAQYILRQNAAGLAETLFDVVDRLEMANDDYVLVGSGSVCTKSDIYWEEFCRLAKNIAPNMRPVRPTLPNVVGEALTMLGELDPDNWQEKRERLLAAVPSMIETSKPACANQQ